MIDYHKTLESPQLLLRPLRQDDYAGFLEITRDKDLWIWFIHELSDQGELRRWLEATLEEVRDQRKIAFTVIDKQTGSVAGSTSIGNISQRDSRVEIGWTWLGRAFQGRGVNDQAKYLLLQYCFEELDCVRVEFKTDVLNLPARNALKRIGATEEGVLRSHTLMTHNRRRDTIYYSILRDEWEKISK